jgi:hypothetical protein
VAQPTSERIAHAAPADDESGASGCASQFCAMQQAAALAAQTRPAEVHAASFTFAGQSVRLRVTGRLLGTYLSDAFGHLRATRPGTMAQERAISPELPIGNPDRASLCIDVWDEAETSIPCPPATACDAPDASESHDIGLRRPADDGELLASRDGRFVAFVRRHSVSWLDRQAGHLVEWRSSAAAVSLYERTKPFRLMLRLWYADRAAHLIHAGLVAQDGHGALLAGAGGAGKSTTTLACLLAGFDYLGDDYVGLEEHDDAQDSNPAKPLGFVGHSVYATARVEPGHLARFPQVLPHAISSHDRRDSKALLLLDGLFPDRLPPSVPISVLLLPRVVDAAETRLRPATRGQALFALAPSTIIAPLGPGGDGLQRLARLAERVPAYWLELGRDLDGVPPVVAQALGAHRP